MLKAKFRVNMVKHVMKSSPLGLEVQAEEVTMNPVYGDTPENKVWSAATPSGNLQMLISNPNAFGALKPNTEYYLTFEEAEPGV